MEKGSKKKTKMHDTLKIPKNAFYYLPMLFMRFSQELKTLFIEKLISSLVIVAYCKTPAIYLWRVGSSIQEAPYLVNFTVLTIGVDKTCAYNIFSYSIR